MVDLRDLRWAVAASQYHSLRQAAAALNIRQSTLSRSLRNIEYRLGAELFERSQRGTHPTSVGREFLATARRIIDEADTAFSRLRLHHKGNIGELSIGVYTALSAGNLRATLTDFRCRFSDVEVRLVDGARRCLLSELAADTLDIAIVTASGEPWKDGSLPLWTERVVAALPSNNPLCAYEVIHWSDLEGERLLLNQRDPGPEFQHLLLAKVGYQDNPQIHLHNVGLDRLLSLVGTGYGITIVAEGATGATYNGVAYREIHDGNGPTRLAFMACWRRSNSNPTLRPFLGILQERYPDLAFGPATGAT